MKAVSVDYKYVRFTSNLYAYPAAIYYMYIQSFRFSSLHLSFVFFFQQDSYKVKVAFVSNCLENLLEDIVFLNGI